MKIKKKKRYEKSIHTKIGFYLILLAGLVEIVLGFRYIFFGDEADQLFGTLTMIEGLFAFSGLYIPDLIIYHRFNLIPSSDEFKKLESDMFQRIIIIIFGLVLIQVAFQSIPLTARDFDKAVATAFAGPAEESFFRGLLISIFIPLGSGMIKSFSIKLPKGREITLIEIIGLMISSLFFMLVHVNYYKYPMMLLSVFSSGLFLGFAYWYWRDLTSCILAHFTLNMFTVFQTFFMVNF